MKHILAVFRAVAFLSGVAAAAPATAGERPVGEYEPVESVVLSARLFDAGYNARAIVRALLQAGVRVILAGSADQAHEGRVRRHLLKGGFTAADMVRIYFVPLPHSSIWLRDIGPATVADDYFPDLARVRLVSMGRTGDQQAAGFGSGLASLHQYELRVVNGDLDGGNLLTAGSRCFMAGIPGRPGIGTQLSAPQRMMLDNISRGLACESLQILDDPPHEHIDMFAKALDPGTVAVNELPDWYLDEYERLTGDRDSYSLRQLAGALNRAAAAIAKTKTVVRLPMPVPWRGTFRTYANSLLVNGVAILPRYRAFGWTGDAWPDAPMTMRMEQQAAAVYIKAGYRVVWVDADKLILNGGALHCVATQIPKAPGD